jgi:hypothetical protein
MAHRLCNDVTNLILSFMIQLNIKEEKYIDNEFSSYMGSDSSSSSSSTLHDEHLSVHDLPHCSQL